MTGVNTFVAQEFTNELGQLVRPGDTVAFMSTAYKSTQIRKGIFEGVYVNSSGKVRGARVGGVPGRRWIWDRTTNKGHYEDVVRKAVLPLARVIRMA